MTRPTWHRVAHDERVGGALLLLAAMAALVAANTPLRNAYDRLLHTRIGPAAWHLDLTVELWATEGLLAIFFFVVGVELAREFRVGSLRDPRRAALPVVAAVGGMLVPALVYALFVARAGHPEALHGWAIPTATDIAFALAVLAVAGRGLPAGVRTFLLTLAVVDDLLGIVVIAIFYSGPVNLAALGAAALGVAAFAGLIRVRQVGWWALLPVALATWVAVHEAGVPPAVTGAVLGLTVPVRGLRGERHGRAGRYEQAWRPWATWVALPIFAFCAAGVSVGGVDEPAALPVALGIVAGLVVGKPLGVLGATLLATRFGRLELPRGVTRADLVPVGLLTGIGFTVALLVAHLSFADEALTTAATLGVLVGSLIAALGAAAGLRLRAQRTGRTSTKAASPGESPTRTPATSS